MESKYSGVTRWRLRNDVAFIDASQTTAKDPTGAEGLPLEAHYPHLIDNFYEEGESQKNMTLLTDMAAFIVQFIAMGVDTEKHLPDILVSEYEDITPETAMAEINNVLKMLENLDYLLPREKMPKPKAQEGFETIKVVTQQIGFPGICSIGPGVWKFYK